MAMAMAVTNNFSNLNGATKMRTFQEWLEYSGKGTLSQRYIGEKHRWMGLFVEDFVDYSKNEAKPKYSSFRSRWKKVFVEDFIKQKQKVLDQIGMDTASGKHGKTIKRRRENALEITR